MKREIWISGNWPFCGNNESKCKVAPGYTCVEKNKGSGLKNVGLDIEPDVNLISIRLEVLIYIKA